MTNDFPPRLGGIETLVRQLCDGLPPDQVVVHTSSTPGDRAFDAELPYPVVRDPARMLLPTPGVRDRVLETFDRHGCDRVVFGASAPLGLLAPALRAAGAAHIQALTHGHEVWWASLPGTRRLMRRIGDGADDLTYVSEYCRDRIAPALSPAARARFRRYPIEVDRERFRPGCGGAEVRASLGHPRSTRRSWCACHGWCAARARTRCWRCGRTCSTTFPDAWLLIVGDGPDRPRLRGMARALGCRRPGGLHRRGAARSGAGVLRRGRRLRDAGALAVVRPAGRGLRHRVRRGGGLWARVVAEPVAGGRAEAGRHERSMRTGGPGASLVLEVQLAAVEA